MAESVLVVKVDARQAVQPLNQVGAAAEKSKTKIKGLGNEATKAKTKLASLKGAASALTGVLSGVAGVAVIGFFRGAANAAAGFEAETLLLERGLKNVGASSGELDRLQQSADRLGKQTLFNEQDLRQGFGLLTSFGNIGVDSYDAVAMAAANVAQVSGTDVSSAFMQLAKALNDPVTNLSALSRSGIQFTEQQKTTIKGLVETGQAAKAQAMILKELEAQYGGTAVAAAGGAAGVRDTFGEAMFDLQKAVGGLVNKALPPFLNALTGLINLFVSLPGPIQAIIVGFVALLGAVAVIAPVIAVLITSFKAIAAAKLGATIAGYLPIFGKLIGILKVLGLSIAKIFLGPVGWAALLVAAGVAIFKFRDQIGQFLRGLLKPFQNVFEAIGRTIRGPFEAAFNFIKKVVNAVLQAIANRINFAIGLINRVIQGANRLPAVNIPLIPKFEIPQFGKGGMVNGGQLAIVGEAGPEYIVPAGKAQGFAENILSGIRGPSAIPAFAEGGYVGPVNITTGPVMQQGGTNYVTMAQFESGIRDVANAMARNGRNYGARRFTGVS